MENNYNVEELKIELRNCSYDLNYLRENQTNVQLYETKKNEWFQLHNEIKEYQLVTKSDDNDSELKKKYKSLHQLGIILNSLVEKYPEVKEFKEKEEKWHLIEAQLRTALEIEKSQKNKSK